MLAARRLGRAGRLARNVLSQRKDLPGELVGQYPCLHLISSVQRHLYSGIQGRRDGTRGGVDTSFRSPTERVWPATRQQEKFAARVYSALTAVLSAEEAFREILVRQLGFSLKAVRVSPDHSKAFILWDSCNGRAFAATTELERRGPRLRAAVAQVLGTRSAPRLEFRHDRLSTEEEQLHRVFEALEEERNAMDDGEENGEEEAVEEGDADASDTSDDSEGSLQGHTL